MGEARILFVEDDNEVRDQLTRLLRDEGYHVLIAVDENEARSLLDETGSEVDLFLIDQKMPSPAALELGRRLRQHAKVKEATPIVVLPFEFDSKLEGMNETVADGDYKAFLATGTQLQEFLARLLNISLTEDDSLSSPTS